MESVSVSSCRCCTFVSCVHPVAVLNAAFCMTCSLLMLVEDARGNHMEEQSQSRNCFVGCHECVLLFTPSCCSDYFFDLYRGLWVCTEILWISVLNVSFGSKVRARTFGCIAMGTELLFIVRSRLPVYSSGSDVNRVQVVLSGFSIRLFCFVQAKPLCRYGCMYFLAALVRVDVMMMLSV